MKKSPFKKKIKVVFWLLFIIAAVGVMLVPPRHAPPPNGVMVKITKPEPEPQKSLGGEEEPNPSPNKSSAITVPVNPEQGPTVNKSTGAPKIAIVIDDVGIDLKGSERAIKLPPQITLSFLPYAVRLREEAKEARDNGHELLLHMPMEPIGHEDPGPGALLVDLPMRDLQQRFETALASFTGFDGVNNHMGSKFTAYPDGMSMVVDELQQRHLFYLDSRTSAQSVGKAIAEQKGLPTIARDVFLDDDQSASVIRAQLEEAEHIAKRKGYAVAIGHPHATTLDVLEAWIPDAQKRGFDLVPVKELVKKDQ